MAARRAGTWAELESSLIRRLERLEGQMNRWADTCMRFMPREWVEAQGFVMADAVLAAVLLGLVTLSYMMVTHMLSSWGEGWKNTTTGASKPIRATAPVPSDPKAPGGVSGGRSSSCAQYGPVNEEIEGMTALMRASSQGDEFCAAELIAAGASVDARDSQEGFTALLMAAAMGTCCRCAHARALPVMSPVARRDPMPASPSTPRLQRHAPRIPAPTGHQARWLCTPPRASPGQTRSALVDSPSRHASRVPSLLLPQATSVWCTGCWRQMPT